ncbi:type I restriction-modification system subunit M [Liberiplasma polymorphum]|uniref:type I restriction-modification system subunit M n=1 Tax=Liberiplasma polymorphum TaxID=3374570 RepID=UPI003772093D
MSELKKMELLWDDDLIDVTSDANFIWSIASKLRGTYMPDKYGDVIIPMTILRRFECALHPTKEKILKLYGENQSYPALIFEKETGYQFYNTSDFSLKKLCNESDKLAENFKYYIEGFSANVQDIMKELDIISHIEKMDKGGCLLTIVKAFSELDLNPETYDSIKMGYIFENLIGRFFQNVDAGQYYTGRDIIKSLVSILTAEGSDDIFEDHKVITVCDQACGTGGMLSTTYSYLKHVNPSADVRLFGQEFMGQSFAVGLAEMLIKGQDARNFKHADTFKEDCFKNKKMRFVIENPPFGTPWSGKDAKEGQERAVKDEYNKAATGNSRWGAGLPAGGDSQLIFMQSAIDKMDDKIGRAAIIQNGSPLFAGNTSSGESQIRKWMLEEDLIEAIIALPTDLFYNTGIQTYVWILSKNKSEIRKNKIQLIDASDIYHKLRKSIGNKKNELTPKDRKRITELYVNFKENDLVKIYDKEEFIYREYVVMQPLQRSYAITEERINNMILKGTLSSIYDEAKVYEYENSLEPLDTKTKKKLQNFYNNRSVYFSILDHLKTNISDKIYYKVSDFEKQINIIMASFDKKIVSKVIEGLSQLDKKAEIQKDKKGRIIYDKDTKDIEIVKINENIMAYMEREVLPHIPDAKAFFEENLTAKNRTIKTGAAIPFNRYFYKYQLSESSEVLSKKLIKIENSVRKMIDELFEE